MDWFMENIRQEHEPRFKALEQGATKLEARASGLEKKMIDSNSSGASGVSNRRLESFEHIGEGLRVQKQGEAQDGSQHSAHVARWSQTG
eukprot:6944480-Pyramimonas_sp.AAC.1